MKKLVCLVLVVALVTLCGCSKPNNNEVISSSNDSSVVKSSKVSSTDHSLNEIDFENITLCRHVLFMFMHRQDELHSDKRPADRFSGKRGGRKQGSP